MKTISLKAALSGVAVVAVAASGLAYAADTLQPSTKQDLMHAMQGEAFATLKYMAYADAARAHGNKELADLFDRVAHVDVDLGAVEGAVAGVELVGQPRGVQRASEREIETVRARFAEERDVARDMTTLALAVAGACLFGTEVADRAELVRQSLTRAMQYGNRTIKALWPPPRWWPAWRRRSWPRAAAGCRRPRPRRWGW